MPQILFEDEEIAVVLKPAGLISQEDAGGKDSAVKRLKDRLCSPIFPVHRLDRETAGVMVFAKTPKAAAALSRLIEEHLFQKEYLALTHQNTVEQKGVMEDLLFFDREKNKVFPVKKMRRGVKKARLRYELAEERNGLFFFRVFPETGRTHQIRVQFASRRMPLFGDRKYGGQGEGLGLFCSSLAFPHPKSGEPLRFEADPRDLAPWKDSFYKES